MVFQLITKARVPIFLASSFAFIAPIRVSVHDFGMSATLGGLAAAGFVCRYTINDELSHNGSFGSVWLTGNDNTDQQFVFITEQQIWFNISEHFSAGTEIELSRNFIYGAGNKIKINPTLGLKWVFKEYLKYLTVYAIVITFIIRRLQLTRKP